MLSQIVLQMICVGYFLLMAQHFKIIFLHTWNQLSVESKRRSSHLQDYLSDWNSSGVFNGNRTHDLCNAGAVILKLTYEATRKCMWAGQLGSWAPMKGVMSEMWPLISACQIFKFSNMRQSLRLCSKSEGHFLNSCLNHTAKVFLSKKLKIMDWTKSKVLLIAKD